MKLLSNIFVLCMFLLISPATSHAEDGHKGMHGGHHVESLIHHAEELGLDDSTVASVQKLIDDAKPRMETLHSELKAAHDELKALMEADAPDEAAVMQQIEMMGAIKTDLRKHQTKTLLAARALLTEEQRASVKKIHEEMREKHHGKKGHHGMKEHHKNVK